MSFLMIRGKVYHCNQCGAFEKVEYEGGPQLTQLGDFGVIIQKELNNRYLPDLSNPEREGYYYHIDECICENCVENVPNIIIGESPKVPDHFMKEWDAQIECFQNKGQEIATNYFHQTMEETTPNELKQLNPMKHMLIKQALKRWDMEKATEQQKLFCTEIKKTLWDRYMNKMLESKEFKMTNQALQDALAAEIKKIIGTLGEDYEKPHYSRLNIDGTDFLNPYILSELSIRKTIKVTEMRRVFYGFDSPDLDLKALKETMQKTNLMDLIRDYLTQMNNDDRSFMNLIAKKLEN